MRSGMGNLLVIELTRVSGYPRMLLAQLAIADISRTSDMSRFKGIAQVPRRLIWARLRVYCTVNTIDMTSDRSPTETLTMSARSQLI